VICVLTHEFLPVLQSGGYEGERDAPSVGPSPIINIKKEKRETEEETKEILRALERDNVSSPCTYVSSCCLPVHLFLAHLLKSNFQLISTSSWMTLT
jgi:hypothetical protein